jgi:rubrerythrin
MKTAMEREMLNLLDASIDLEVQLARYYRVMVYFAPEYSDTWNKLSKQETVHARLLGQVLRSIEEEPEKFTSGKITVQAARMLVEEVEDMRRAILCEEVTPQRAISFILGIETSAFESYTSELVMTDVEVVNEVLEKLKVETAEHRRLLEELVEGY